MAGSIAKKARKESKSEVNGRDYPADRARVPWNASIDEGNFGNETSRTVFSPAESTWDPPMTIHHGYDKLWEGR